MQAIALKLAEYRGVQVYLKQMPCSVTEIVQLRAIRERCPAAAAATAVSVLQGVALPHHLTGLRHPLPEPVVAALDNALCILRTGQLPRRVIFITAARGRARRHVPNDFFRHAPRGIAPVNGVNARRHSAVAPRTCRSSGFCFFDQLTGIIIAVVRDGAVKRLFAQDIVVFIVGHTVTGAVFVGQTDQAAGGVVLIMKTVAVSIGTAARQTVRVQLPGRLRAQRVTVPGLSARRIPAVLFS